MRSRMRVCGLVAAALVVSLPGWSRADDAKRADLIAPSILARADLAKYWQARADLWPDERVVRIRLLDENLYCITDRGRPHGDVYTYRRLSAPCHRGG